MHVKLNPVRCVCLTHCMFYLGHLICTTIQTAGQANTCMSLPTRRARKTLVSHCPWLVGWPTESQGQQCQTPRVSRSQKGWEYKNGMGEVAQYVPPKSQCFLVPATTMLVLLLTTHKVLQLFLGASEYHILQLSWCSLTLYISNLAPDVLLSRKLNSSLILAQKIGAPLIVLILFNYL